MATTTLSLLIDPEVMSDIVSAALTNKIRFSPIAQVLTNLQGRPGSTLSFPSWGYIGDATDVAEGAPIPLDQMSTSEKSVTIKKAAKGVEITDEAILSGLGDPIGEANNQLALAIAAKVDADLLTAAQTATQKSGVVFNGTVAGLRTGLSVFGDEDDEPAILVVNPVDAAKLQDDAIINHMLGSEVGANALISGNTFNVLGTQIVRSNKVVAGAALLIKQGALALVMKRDVQVEADRDITTKTTVITADEHYAAYLYNPAKVVKFAI